MIREWAVNSEMLHNFNLAVKITMSLAAGSSNVGIRQNITNNVAFEAECEYEEMHTTYRFHILLVDACIKYQVRHPKRVYKFPECDH